MKIMTRVNKNSSRPCFPHLPFFYFIRLIEKLGPLCFSVYFFFFQIFFCEVSPSVCVSFSVSVSCSLSVPPSALIERLCTVGTERKEKPDNDTRQYCVENPDLLYTRLFTHILHTLALPPTLAFSSCEAHAEHVFMHVLSG